MGFIFLIVVLFNFGWIRWTFFPSIPFDSILVEFTYQPGERENKTENFLWYCDSIVDEYNQELIKRYNDTIITYKSVSVGSTETLGEVGSHVGSVRISVKENDHISTIDMSNELRKKFPEDSIRLLEKFTVGGQQRFGKEVSISLQSEERKELEKAANWMKDQIGGFPEVKNVLDNSGIGNRELHLRTKKSKAYLLGLNEMAISNQIRQGFLVKKYKD
jgi:multidrug efflux pump subunit AcrB